MTMQYPFDLVGLVLGSYFICILPLDVGAFHGSWCFWKRKRDSKTTKEGKNAEA